MRTSTSRVRRTSAAAGALLVAAVMLAGCSGGSDNSSESSGAGAAPLPQDREAKPQATGQTDEAGKPGSTETGKSGSNLPSLTPSIVRTGYLTVEAKDVQGVRQQVTTIVAGLRGIIATEDSGSDDEGQLQRANLVLRIPTAAYDRAMSQLADPKLGKVKQIKQESTDVTEQVVDINSRVASQRDALNRMRAMLSRANTIAEIISVESELTRRETELESLLARQKSLAGQTELATVTLTLVRPGEAPPPPSEPDRGFLTGLSRGWGAFSAAVAVLATFAGALLPFAIALALIATPTWYILQRRRPLTPAPAQAHPDDPATP